MLHPRLILTALIAVAIAVAGCGDDGPAETRAEEPAGTPLPVIPTIEGTPTPEPTPTPTPTPTPDPAATELQPCAMLDADDMERLGVEPGVQDQVASARTCQWLRSGHYTISVAIWEKLGLADVRSNSKPRPLTIGARDAVRATGGVSACAYALELSETSRVDVSAAANGDEARACRVARRMAPLVESKLP